MRISEKVKIIEIKSKTKDIICNKCRRSCQSGMSGTTPDYDGLLETSITGGYHSKLGDEVTYTFSICEKCLKEIFDSFLIPPEKSNDGFPSDGMSLYWATDEYNLTDRCLKIINKDENFKEFKEPFITRYFSLNKKIIYITSFKNCTFYVFLF